MANKLFGTDGIRGIANTYPLTADFCLRLAKILSRNICKQKKAVLIARDTRISGDMLFSALSAGFLAEGINVFDAGIIPTPLCTTLTPQLPVDMSIMITASHNPYKDNGLKLINEAGDKFSDEQTDLVERLLSEVEDEAQSFHTVGTIKRLSNIDQQYYQKIENICKKNALSDMKIAIDSANGCFSRILAPLFKELGADVISLADSPNGININENCGSQHTEKLSETVINNHCDMGIAVDGDGDRIIICDEKGARLDGDQIIAFLATYMQKHNMLKGQSVVSTICSNLGLAKYINSLGLQHYMTPVGERYVIEKMQEIGCNLGGEESGHMVLSDYAKTGDALFAAVMISLGIKEREQRVSQIFPIFVPFPNQSTNLRFEDKATIEKIMSATEVKQAIDLVANKLKGHGSILVRKSGTEPVIRIKIEDEDASIVKNEMTYILDCIKKYS